MAGGTEQPAGPDLTAGIPLTALREGEPVTGTLGGEPVLVVRIGEAVHAVSATCTHYGGPLAEGLVVGDTVRCPWHHACFSLKTGEALKAPALNPLPVWRVHIEDGVAYLRDRTEPAPLSARGRIAEGPGSVVIVGAGAAGSAAAEMLRREGYRGRVVVIDRESDAPYDRPNLSKDYLAGNAPEEWIPLRPPGFFAEHDIERVDDVVESIDRRAHRVQLASGDSIDYGALLLACGAVPRTLAVPGSDQSHVFVLRSLVDARAIIERVATSSAAVVIGASFIAMEVAASLRARGLGVSVVAPDALPFERTLGVELGRLLHATHERNDVAFHLGRTVSRIADNHVVLDDGTRIGAQLVVVGVGVAPETRLAEAAGLEVSDGVIVDEHLCTSDAAIYAAGDAARWRDVRTGEHVRIEHWVVAQRQGQAAARSILGRNEPFDDVPFFWTNQFDVGIRYIGHAREWDAVEVDGDVSARDASLRYVRGGRTLAFATLGRDRQCLEEEAAMEAVARQS